MHNGLKYIFTFSLGAAVGSVVAWKLLKTKYERLAQEEIDSVKEVYSRMNATKTEESDNAENEKAPDMIEHLDEAVNLIREEGYSYSVSSDQVAHPYVISPDEFGEHERDYETISLVYFDDQVLADEDTLERVEDVDNTVGFESLTRFGEYEPDSVHVRNDRLHCDYEILLDVRTYAEALKQKAKLNSEGYLNDAT